MRIKKVIFDIVNYKVQVITITKSIIDEILKPLSVGRLKLSFVND